MSRQRTALATELRAARARRGWTLEQLADAAGKSVPTIHGYESGAIEPPGLVLLRIARLLDVPIKSLIQAAA